jgi:hypothetical protein
MGIENHNAVLATTWDREYVEIIRAWVEGLKCEQLLPSFHDPRRLFVFGPELINGYTTVVMLPDGSKEGWVESDYIDDLRDRFIERLEEDGYDDGSNPWDWIEVGYGEYGQKVLRGNCQNRYSDQEYAG